MDLYSSLEEQIQRQRKRERKKNQ